MHKETSHPTASPDGARGNNDVDHRVVSHQASVTASNSIIGAGRIWVCLRVIPVLVQGLCNGRVIETYALLDDGADVLLCDHRLLEKLGLNGISRQFTLTTLSNTEEQSGLEVAKVCSLDGVKDLCLPLPACQLKEFPCQRRAFQYLMILRRWPHLQDLSFPQIDDQTVMLLIGGYCPKAF